MLKLFTLYTSNQMWKRKIIGFWNDSDDLFVSIFSKNNVLRGFVHLIIILITLQISCEQHTYWTKSGYNKSLRERERERKRDLCIKWNGSIFVDSDDSIYFFFLLIYLFATYARHCHLALQSITYLSSLIVQLIDVMWNEIEKLFELNQLSSCVIK